MVSVNAHIRPAMELIDWLFSAVNVERAVWVQRLTRACLSSHFSGVTTRFS